MEASRDYLYLTGVQQLNAIHSIKTFSEDGRISIE